MGQWVSSFKPYSIPSNNLQQSLFICLQPTALPNASNASLMWRRATSIGRISRIEIVCVYIYVIWCNHMYTKIWIQSIIAHTHLHNSSHTSCIYCSDCSVNHRLFDWDLPLKHQIMTPREYPPKKKTTTWWSGESNVQDDFGAYWGSIEHRQARGRDRKITGWKNDLGVPSGNLTWLRKVAVYSGFSHWKMVIIHCMNDLRILKMNFDFVGYIITITV